MKQLFIISVLASTVLACCSTKKISEELGKEISDSTHKVSIIVTAEKDTVFLGDTAKAYDSTIIVVEADTAKKDSIK